MNNVFIYKVLRKDIIKIHNSFFWAKKGSFTIYDVFTSKNIMHREKSIHNPS